MTIPKHYSIPEVLTKVNLFLPFQTFDGNLVKMQSQRYKLFMRDIHKLHCTTCGIKATHFLLQRGDDDIRYHFNLFSDDTLMTKDHIIAKSKGGRNVLQNYQIMCTYCNNEKGNK